MSDYERIKEYLGKDFDCEDLMSCLTDKNIHVEFEEVDDYIELDKIGCCTLYKIYYDVEGSNVYDIWVDRSNMIASITVNN